MKNLLAIAVATKINFREAENVKAIVAKTEPLPDQTERGHVTGAQSTLSPAAERSSSTPEDISCSKGEKHSIEEFDYNESTGSFSLRGREKKKLWLNTKPPHSQSLRQFPRNLLKLLALNLVNSKTGLTLTLKLLRTSAPESPS